MASDSETFLRIFDSHSEDGGVAPDPVVAAETIDQFVNLLRSQYISSGFSIRKKLTRRKFGTGYPNPRFCKLVPPYSR